MPNINDYTERIWKSNKLEPITCKGCVADGHGVGMCDKCLRAQARNVEYIATHHIPVDDELQAYHCGTAKHEAFKRTPLREANERPYLYYGIELEIEFDESELYALEDVYDGYEATDTLADVLKEFTKITGGMFIYEQDGSLNNGVEFISRPTSYAKWTNPETVEKLKKGLEYLVERGALLRQPTGNGMHIHVSKGFFEHGDIVRKDDEKPIDKAYQEMDWLFQYCQEEIEKLGGRHYTAYCRSKKDKIQDDMRNGLGFRSNGLVKMEYELKAKMKVGGGIAYGDHYTALNSTNKTIEARVFRSTVDYKEVLARIEIMRNFCHAVRNHTVIGDTLEGILHTKDNKYLDEYIDKIRKEEYKNKSKVAFDKVIGDEIEIAVKTGEN